MSNFQVYQPVLPTISVWQLRSNAEVAEAYELIQRGEHTFHYRKHSHRDGKSWPFITAKDLKQRPGELYSEWWENEYGNSSSHHEKVHVRQGSTLVLSSNGKAVIFGLGSLPEVVRATDLPAFILAPELHPLG